MRKPSSSMLDLFRSTFLGEAAEAVQAFRAAQFHKNNRNYLKSRRLLEHAFRLDPDNTDILVALGEALEGSWRTTRVINADQNKGTDSSSLIRLSPSFDSGDDALLLIADQMYTRALIVNPHLESAGNHKSRLMPLVEEIDQRRLVPHSNVLIY
ncbi:Adenosine monophosphate-protein transferase FICD [Fasciolopsis buskii]|uniref:Adenosine monophosphate-protein transferase FICD n=1 Tax=Fasciolopsis buskii TaxID=27845 RepID=A0A8E0VIU8_9TREM|nr:Adenosine monophosphate-protein transferase FICD [Fasciolopsis buski]